MCPACAHNSSRSTAVPFRQGLRGEKVLRQCRQCQSFFDPDNYDEQKEVQHTLRMPWGDTHSGKDLNKFKMKMYHSVLTLLSQYCPPPATLLDAGCAYGGFLDEASKQGYKVCGYDILPEAVDYVRTLDLPAERAFSIGAVKSVQDGTLDVLTCLDCNCYWQNQPSELRCAFAKLRPGGYLVMRVVDKSWLFSLGLRIHQFAPVIGKQILTRAINDHRFSMPVQSLLKVIRRCGFEVIVVSPYRAIHSTHTRWLVKLSFALGTLLWATTGIFMAPGAVILTRKPDI